MNKAEKCVFDNIDSVKRPGTGFKEETGNKYGRLTVVGIHSHGPNQFTQWNCVCDCGKKCVKQGYRLRAGKVKSCGCLARSVTGDRCRTHGATDSPEYRIWCGIKRRCFNSATPNFHRYGGRGITMCPEWRVSFPAFFLHMGPRPSPQHSIDRIDVSKNYEPSNCVWATSVAQGNNRSTNRRVEFGGKSLTYSQWARKIGVSQTTLRNRIAVLKWPIERALTTPCRKERLRQKLESAMARISMLETEIIRLGGTIPQ